MRAWRTGRRRNHRIIAHVASATQNAASRTSPWPSRVSRSPSEVTAFATCNAAIRVQGHATQRLSRDRSKAGRHCRSGTSSGTERSRIHWSTCRSRARRPVLLIARYASGTPSTIMETPMVGTSKPVSCRQQTGTPQTHRPDDDLDCRDDRPRIQRKPTTAPWQYHRHLPQGLQNRVSKLAHFVNSILLAFAGPAGRAGGLRGMTVVSGRRRSGW